MFKAAQFRAKAQESAESLKHTDVPAEIREFQRSVQSFNQLAQNEDWLANNFEKMVHAGDALPPVEITTADPGSAPIVEMEEKVLRCLGAAVIMQWSAIPKNLQHDLFDTAGSLGGVIQTVALRGQIARFLHDHKDEEVSMKGTLRDA
jgi:hypothetical protein